MEKLVILPSNESFGCDCFSAICDKYDDDEFRLQRN